MTLLRAILAALACGVVSVATAAGQPSQDEIRRVEEKWRQLRAHAERQVTATASGPTAKTLPADLAARDDAARGTSVSAAADAVEPDAGTAAATVQRLAGAIRANPEGTEAGLVIAPFALAGADRGRGLELTFAALKADVTRVGASYTWSTPASDEDLWAAPPRCEIDESVTEQLDKPRGYFLSACAQVVPLLDPADGRVHAARVSCGLDQPSTGGPEVRSLEEGVANIRAVLRWADRQPLRGGPTNEPAPVVFPERALLGVAAIRGFIVEIETWRQPSSTSCYRSEDVKGYFRQLYWDKGTLKLAAGAQWDLFPRKHGFSPDGGDLPSGEAQAFLGRVDLAYARRGTEFGAGVGFGQSRTKIADELTGVVSLSTSVARAFTLLQSAKLRDDKGRLKPIDGELPPRLVLGLAISVELALDKPDSQDSTVNSALIQPYIDFVISDTLSFRLGAPVKAEIAVRDAKAAVAATDTTPAVPAVLEKRGLQWTLPVAIVAVLKL